MSQPLAPDGVFGHVTEAGAPDPSPPGADRPAWAPTAVATDVPALDDVLDGTVDVAGTFRDKPRKPGKGKKSRKPTERRPERPERPERPAWPEPSEPSEPGELAGPGEPATRSRRRGGSRRDDPAERSRPPVRQLVDAGGRAVGTQGRRAVRLARRRPRGAFARRRTLVAAAGIALVAGAGAGAGIDAVQGGGEPTAAATIATVTPEACATAQVTWARAAAAQARMDVASPKTLRSGFVGARDALSRQTPPDAVAAEWATVTDYVTAVADAVTEADDDALESTVLTTIADLDTEAMTTASERITAYLSADCAA